MRTSRPPTDRGAALILALLMVSFLGAVGGALLMSVTLDVWISVNYRDAAQLLYLAEAGAEESREILRVSSASPSALLAAAAGPDGVLALSRDLDELLQSDDAPITQGGGVSGQYRVYLRNDAADGPANPIDSNGVVTLLSIASHGALRKTIEVTVLRKRIPGLTAALTLDGSPVLFALPDSTGFAVSGMDASGTGNHAHAVGVITAGDLATVLLAIPQGAEAQFPGTSSFVPPPADVAVVEAELGTQLKTTTGLERLARDIESVATDVLSPPPDQSAVLGQVGRPDDPRVVVVNGDCILGSGDGFGILLVRGVLTLGGNFRWTCVILAIGQGDVRSTGGGGQVSGGMLLARTRDSQSGAVLAERGSVSFDLRVVSGIRIEIDRGVENALVRGFPYTPIAIREY